MNNNPMVGQVWLSRDKKRTFTILSVSAPGTGMPITAIDDRKIILSFTKEGYFISPSFPNPNDLVERL